MRSPKTAKTLSVVTLLLVASIVAVWLAASPEAGDRSDYNVAREPRPFGLYSPGTLEGLAPESAERVIGALGLANVADYQDYSLGLIEALGVTWVRLDILYDGDRFNAPEEHMAKLQANGVEIAACVRSAAPLGDDELALYEERLGDLVGQHPDVRVWQIDSEPGSTYPDVQAYLDLFFAGRRAVSESCPDCRIALAGAPALVPGRQSSLDYYDRLLEAISARREGDEPLFEIFDIHFYGLAGDGELLLEAADDYRNLLDRHGLDAGVSFWMSECATYSGMPSYPLGLPAQSEQQQAGELVIRFVTMLGAGGERVAWASLHEKHDTSGVVDGYHDYSGLVYNGLGAEAEQGPPAGTRKAAFAAYGTLVEELDGFSGVSAVARGQYRFSFDDGRQPVYVVWSVEDTALADELTGSVSVTTLAGEAYNSLALEPGDTPVFVKKR